MKHNHPTWILWPPFLFIRILFFEEDKIFFTFFCFVPFGTSTFFDGHDDGDFSPIASETSFIYSAIERRLVLWFGGQSEWRKVFKRQEKNRWGAPKIIVCFLRESWGEKSRRESHRSLWEVGKLSPVTVELRFRHQQRTFTIWMSHENQNNNGRERERERKTTGRYLVPTRRQNQPTKCFSFSLLRRRQTDIPHRRSPIDLEFWISCCGR